jgi:CDP-diglyceride synthetase
MACFAGFALSRPYPWLIALAAFCVPVVFFELLNLCNSAKVPHGIRKALKMPMTNASPRKKWWIVGQALVAVVGTVSLVVWDLRDQPTALAIIVCVVMTDIFAWGVGSLASFLLMRIGLEPWRFARTISPNKTWAGTVGGFIGGVLSGLVAAAGLAGWHSPTPHIYGLLILASLSAIAGDLFESQVKRKCRVKDTSQAIPGHGGLVDRFDSLWFTFCVLAGAVWIV